MSDLAIRVRNLSKSYLIGRSQKGELVHDIPQKLKRLFRLRSAQKEEFWALKDIDFEIQKGEAVGIIGRNGAGKSTLLKILSRITEPTTGCFEIYGRVSSLLEVGTGFHMELTGRENIFLNGTILGMKKKEIREKFDDIVEFSGVEPFLDTPVKHYSSGMKVRLAFSVAAHLEPEILIVDEVLAVGDVEFQKKCLGKMNEVSKNEGRTVLFVSHNLNALTSICEIGILLSQGSVKAVDKIGKVVSNYLRNEDNLNLKHYKNDVEIGPGIYIERIEIHAQHVVSFENIKWLLRFRFEIENLVSELAILVFNEVGQRVGIIDLRSYPYFDKTKLTSSLEFKGVIHDIPLIEGNYSLGIYILSNQYTANVYDLIRFSVVGAKVRVSPFPVESRGLIEFKNEQIG
jgi:lipopolysaccharide transport system ATP-binding protein